MIRMSFLRNLGTSSEGETFDNRIITQSIELWKYSTQGMINVRMSICTDIVLVHGEGNRRMQDSGGSMMSVNAVQILKAKWRVGNGIHGGQGDVARTYAAIHCWLCLPDTSGLSILRGKGVLLTASLKLRNPLGHN